MSSYAQDPSTGGGSVYAQTGTASGSAYSGRPTTTAAKKKKDDGRGILGEIGHFFSQGGADIKNAAVNTPAGIAAVVTAAAHDISKGNIPNPADPQSLVKWWQTSESAQIDKAMAKQTVETLKHPLRHPGDTALTLLPFAGAASKAALVGRAAKAGEISGARNIAKALVTKNPPPPRVLKVGGMETRGHYSRASTAQLVQRATDAGLQKAAQGTSKTALRAENALHKRVAKWDARNQRVADAVARAPGTRLSTLGKSLKPEELRALRLVAEEVPVARRLGAQEMRKARAVGKEVGRHQERIDLTKGALAFLDEHPTTGAPVFKPSAKKLENVYGALKAASSDREGMLKNLSLMDDVSQQAAKTKVAQIAAGGTYVKPTPSRLGQVTPGLARATARVNRLEKMSEKAAAKMRFSAADLRKIGPEYKPTIAVEGGKAITLAEARARLQSFHDLHDKMVATIYKQQKGNALVDPDVAKGISDFNQNIRQKPSNKEFTKNYDILEHTAEVPGGQTWRYKPGGEDYKAPSRRMKTQTQLWREQAEKTLQDMIDSQPDSPLAKEYLRREAEAVRLREGINALDEKHLFKSKPTTAELRTHLGETPGKKAAAEGDIPAGQHVKLSDGRVVTSDGRIIQPTGYARVTGLNAAISVAREEHAAALAAAAKKVKPTGIVGAEDITASPAAVFIGNPVERARLTGKPKVSSTGTFGHTQKPSSLRTSTGSSVEHALERQDVTNIVAERHAEAVRLSTIDRVRARVKPAGEAVPRRKDDIFMWTDKLISNERIPKDVRRYLDNPESLAALPPTERVSIAEQIKQAVFEHRDWRDPATVAEFTKLAEEGKGVFVPRRLLGNYAKREIVGSGPVVHFADAVNNAQKAGLVYLKVNYPVVQALSNTAMNLIQGAANPHKITKAVKVYHGDPVLVSVAEDIMGQGAILQAAFEGQGTIARGTQKLAHAMSHKVDTPARLLALYHEADLAGFGSKARFRELIFDEKNAKALAEVAQRAKEAIVDYGEMSPFERGVVRRLIFVYPWQKGATKYAGHFLRDHPVQAAALDQVSQQSGEPFGPVPSYLEGAFKVGGGLVNPAGVNFFETPAQIGESVAGLLGNNPGAAAQGQNFLSPVPGVSTALLTGRDDFGRPLQGNLAAKLRDLLVAQTPIAGVGRAAAPNSDLVKAILGDRTASKSFPNPNDAFYRFLLGGLYPRDYNKPALNRNAALEKSGR